jgi:hypothetical protein
MNSFYNLTQRPAYSLGSVERRCWEENLTQRPAYSLGSVERCCWEEIQ